MASGSTSRDKWPGVVGRYVIVSGSVHRDKQDHTGEGGVIDIPEKV